MGEDEKRDEAEVLLVNIGNMGKADLSHVKFDENYERMVEDFLGTFNHAITQGQAPIRVLFSFASAFAVALGYCVRAGLSAKVAGKLVAMIVRNSDASAKMIKFVTKGPEQKQ